MQWIETIRVLCSLRDANDFKDDLNAQLRGFYGTKGSKQISVILQSAYEYDLVVMLFWNKQQQPAKTMEGEFIANYLKQFGSVNHSVWTVISEICSKSRRQRDKINVVRNSSKEPS